MEFFMVQPLLLRSQRLIEAGGNYCSPRRWQRAARCAPSRIVGSENFNEGSCNVCTEARPVTDEALPAGASDAARRPLQLGCRRAHSRDAWYALPPESS